MSFVQVDVVGQIPHQSWHQVTGWCPWRLVSYNWFSVGLCCCKFGRSVVAVAVVSGQVGTPAVGPVHSIHLCHFKAHCASTGEGVDHFPSALSTYKAAHGCDCCAPSVHFGSKAFIVLLPVNKLRPFLSLFAGVLVWVVQERRNQ